MLNNDVASNLNSGYSSSTSFSDLQTFEFFNSLSKTHNPAHQNLTTIVDNNFSYPYDESSVELLDFISQQVVSENRYHLNRGGVRLSAPDVRTLASSRGAMSSYFGNWSQGVGEIYNKAHMGDKELPLYLLIDYYERLMDIDELFMRNTTQALDKLITQRNALNISVVLLHHGVSTDVIENKFGKPSVSLTVS